MSYFLLVNVIQIVLYPHTFIKNQNIDISSLQKGIYVVNLVEKGKVSVYKLIKM